MGKDTAKSRGEIHGEQDGGCGEKGCRGTRCKSKVISAKTYALNRRITTKPSPITLPVNNSTKAINSQSSIKATSIFPCLDNDLSKQKVKIVVENFILNFKVNFTLSVSINIVSPINDNSISPDSVSIIFQTKDSITESLIEKISLIFNDQETFISKDKLLILIPFRSLRDEEFNEELYSSIVNDMTNQLDLESISLGNSLFKKNIAVPKAS